jgi:hypothetical protein
MKAKRGWRNDLPSVHDDFHKHTSEAGHVANPHIPFNETARQQCGLVSAEAGDATASRRPRRAFARRVSGLAAR